MATKTTKTAKKNTPATKKVAAPKKAAAKTPDTDKLRTAIVNALTTFEKINDIANAEIIEKLRFVIGSFDFDKNPIGLYEFGEKALPILTSIKEKNTKLVTKKVIDDLVKVLAK